MKVDDRWRKLTWRHPLWDYVRFYAGLNKGHNYHKEWVAKLKEGVFEVDPGIGQEPASGGPKRKPKPITTPIPEARKPTILTVPPEHLPLFLKYVEERDAGYEEAALKLRTKEQALDYCEGLKLVVAMTKTKLVGWQDSPKAMVAAVTNVANIVCEEKSVGLVASPQKRGVWLIDNDLHVSARNLDGAIPSLFQPSILWEVKEYWGGGDGKDGGSKMSDAVYECNLVGRELREFEERTNRTRIAHIVFLDGYCQWAARSSDLKRFIDLFHQGLIDYLFVGKEVETDWKPVLEKLLS
jgi:hypothetical protein